MDTFELSVAFTCMGYLLACLLIFGVGGAGGIKGDMNSDGVLSLVDVSILAEVIRNQ